MAADQGTIDRYADRVRGKAAEIIRLMAEISLDLKYYKTVIGGANSLKAAPPTAQNITADNIEAAINVFTYLRTTFNDNEDALWALLQNAP